LELPYESFFSDDAAQDDDNDERTCWLLKPLERQLATAFEDAVEKLAKGNYQRGTGIFCLPTMIAGRKTIIALSQVYPSSEPSCGEVLTSVFLHRASMIASGCIVLHELENSDTPLDKLDKTERGKSELPVFGTSDEFDGYVESAQHLLAFERFPDVRESVRREAEAAIASARRRLRHRTRTGATPRKAYGSAAEP
jgi:hypothetical protein